MPEVGIFITAKDLATKALKGVGTTGKTSLNAVRAVAQKAQRSFEALGGAVTAVNQAMELGKKAWEIGRMAMEQTVGVALQFRKAGDPMLKWFTDMKRESELVRARLGDALLPVIKGLAEGLGLAGKGVSEWVKENRKLIATNVLNFVLNVGEVLVNSVAKGALLVVKIWKGWQEVILLVTAGAEKMFAGIISGAQMVLEKFAAVASAVGADGLAAQLSEASAAAEMLSDTFSKSGDESLAQLEKTVAGHRQLEDQINSIADVALTKLKNAGVAAQQAIQQSVAGTTQNIEEQKERLTNLETFIDELREARLAKIQEAADRELQIAQEKDRLILEQQQSIVEAATAANEFMGGLIDSIANETASAQQMMAEAQQAAAEGSADAVEKMNAAREAQGKVAGKVAKQAASAVIDSIMAQIAGYAVSAAAGAFASQAGIPIVGPALGAAAAVAASAAVLALGAGLKGLIAGLAGGGVITGGVPGRDSVPAMLMPGEQVMSVHERRAMQKFMGRLLGAQAGQTAGGLAGSSDGQPGRTLVVNNQTVLRTWTPNLNEETQMARQLEEQSRARLARQGMLMKVASI